MVFAGVNYIAIIVAAFAAFGFGAVWYMSLSKPWLAAAGIDPAKMATREGKPDRSPFIISFLGELFLAWVLAGLIGHMGAVTVSNALISASRCGRGSWRCRYSSTIAIRCCRSA